MYIEKNEGKRSLYTDNITRYLKYSKDLVEKLLEIITVLQCGQIPDQHTKSNSFLNQQK